MSKKSELDKLQGPENESESIDPALLKLAKQEFRRPRCKKCQVSFEEGDEFCMACGNRVRMPKSVFYFCMECGKPIPKVRYRMDTREHCPHCGQISKPQPKDRPVWILANIA